MISVCSQCGGKLNIQVSPQVIQCPYCGSSVEVKSLDTEVYIVKPVIEKNVAWNITRAHLGGINSLQGYLVPFIKGKYFLPSTDKVPLGLKIVDGERYYGGGISGFKKMQSSQCSAYAPYWYAQGEYADIWLSGVDGKILLIEKKNFKNKQIIRNILIACIALLCGLISLKSIPLALVIWGLSTLGGLFWQTRS
jgi:DNA-directed RNA polymerase subunit RPC12/RpoP